MLNTFIKNRGQTKTIIHNKNKNKINEINWDADYDGEDANIHLTTKTNGVKKHFDIQLDNNDLANIFNIPSVDKPLHKRLKADFIQKSIPQMYKIELPDEEEEEQELEESPSIEQLINSSNFLSSPSPGDQLIIPVPISSRTSDRYTLTSRRRHKRPKTHRTYRVYKLHKRSSRSSSRSKSNRKKTSKSHKI